MKHLSQFKGRVFGIGNLAALGKKSPELAVIASMDAKASATLAFRRSVVNGLARQSKYQPRQKPRPKTSTENMRALNAALNGTTSRAKNIARLSRTLSK